MNLFEWLSCFLTVKAQDDQDGKKSKALKARTITIRIFSTVKNIDDLKQFVVDLVKSYKVCSSDT